MEMSFRAVRVEDHDGAGEASLLVVFDSLAAESSKEAKEKKRASEKPGWGCLEKTGEEAGEKVRIHSPALVPFYSDQARYFKLKDPRSKIKFRKAFFKMI